MSQAALTRLQDPRSKLVRGQPEYAGSPCEPCARPDADESRMVADRVRIAALLQRLAILDTEKTQCQQQDPARRLQFALLFRRECLGQQCVDQVIEDALAIPECTSRSRLRREYVLWEDALVTSLFYSALGAKAAIYVYGSLGRSPQELSAVERRAKELQLVSEQVRAKYDNAEMVWSVGLVEPFALQAFLIGDDLSIAGVAVLGPHFLKLSLTFFDYFKMRELMMRDTVRELARLALKH